MIDATTHKPLTVLAGGEAGPYIMVPVQQLDAIRRLLDAHDVRYWVDEQAISINGKPYVTVINLARQTDGSAVQRLLDGAA
jgi:hypothetical protein